MSRTARELVVSVLARRARLNESDLADSSRLVEDLSLDGDDAIDAILEISKEAGVDLTGFDASLYFRPEPTLPSAFTQIFQRRKVAKLPLTVGELIGATAQGRLPAKP